MCPNTRFSIIKQKVPPGAGFSILEMLVTAAIIGIITAVVAIKYGSFNNLVLLKNEAFEIALDIREVQGFAVSVRGEEAKFREDYGLYFDLKNPQRYLTFLDNGDRWEGGVNKAYYDTGEEIGLPKYIDSRFSIKRICVNIVNANDPCPKQVDDLSISFKRPDFDARFASADCRQKGYGQIDNARIELTGIGIGTDTVNTVVISPTGQISVE